MLQKCLNLSDGARFYRADLHIHSYGASHDVIDKQMTPTNIVSTAIKENLAIIAVADHNEIRNVQEVLQVAATSIGLLVIPSVELSTSQGHLLCYLPTFDHLNKFFNRLTIADRGTKISRCQNSIIDCLNLLEQNSGFGVLAHIDDGGGFETEVPGASPHKLDVLCHRALLGIELKSPSSKISYSDTDPNPSLAAIGRERINRLSLGSKQFLARVLNSDAHTLDALGHNAEGDKKVTRIKMDQPSFAALRIAFEDCDARIRIENTIPSTLPTILGVHLEGGFLNNQTIHFSKNLNCIIGGRGAGKSLTFEAIRLLTGTVSDNPIIDSEVWPNKLYLFWQDQAEQQHRLSRSTGEELENMDDIFDGPVKFELDCFGQGEAAKISEKAKTDPLALLRFLDGFIDISDPVKAETESREKLMELQTKIEDAQKKVDSIPQFIRVLQTTQKQLQTLEKAKARDVIELQRKLTSEREVRKQICEKMSLLKEEILNNSTKKRIEELKSLVDPTILEIGKVEFNEILKNANAFETCVDGVGKQVKEGFATFSQAADQLINLWKSKDLETQKLIDKKRQELETQGIRFDMAYIQKLAKDEAIQKQNVDNLKKWSPYLADLKKERSAVLKKRWEAREKVATIRDAYGRIASQTLNEVLSDLHVSLKYTRNAYSPEATELIIQTMGWRTIQQQRAVPLVEQLTIPNLLKAIEQNDTSPIINLKTPEGVPLFNKTEANTIIEKLGQSEIKFALDRCELFDLPRLTVTKMLKKDGESPKYLTREYTQLSLGQQQSVLLSLMMSSNSNKPLIIDQPEDNLDSEFIYHTLVPVLRLAKERRQVIIVTHNPNVAILGDAEQIIVLKSTSEKAQILARGSIDNTETCKYACSILEGAKEAFIRRAKIYGVTPPSIIEPTLKKKDMIYN